MRSWGPLVAAAVLAALPAFATVERLVMVAQPIVTDEYDLCISEVTYFSHSDASWGDLVDFTCRANYIAIDNYEGAENHNAANLAGIKAEVDRYHFQEQALYGDTVRVMVDLSEMDASKVRQDPEELVDATIECVLINASRSMQGWDSKKSASIDAKHLRVDVVGSPEYARLSRAYPFKELLKRKLDRGCYGSD